MLSHDSAKIYPGKDGEMPARVAFAGNIELTDSSAISRFATEWWTPRLAGPVIAAAVVRLALLSITLTRIGTSALFHGDTMSYLEPGRNLLLHGRFIADGVPDLLRAPGYPLFLAVTSLAGFHAAALANVILSVFSVLLTWRLGRAVFDDGRIALGAAWISAFEPLSVVFSVAFLSETLFLVLFLLSMERLAVFLRGRRLRALAVAGLWLAAATFVRPVTYYLPVALALGLFVVLVRVPDLPPQRQRPVARSSGLHWKAPAVLLISVLPWLAAWQVRNWVETGYSGFSSIRELNLYFFNAAEVTARVDHRSFLDVRNGLGYVELVNHSGQDYLDKPYLALHPEQAGWSQGQRLAFMHSQAAAIIRAHYGLYLRSCLTSLVQIVFDPGTGYFDRLLIPKDRAISSRVMDEGPVRWGFVLVKTHPWVAVEKAVSVVVIMGLCLFAIRGVFLIVQGGGRGGICGASLWLLLGTSLYFLAVSAAGAAPWADARLRMPVMPAICILAVAGFLHRKTVAR